jgi:hypothetical protein
MLASAVAVAQGQSTRLWLWGLGVQIPSATPVKAVTRGGSPWLSTMNVRR